MKSAVEILKKRAPSGEQSKQWPQIIALLSGGLAAFTSGSLFSWTSPAVPKLLNSEDNISIEDASYLSVIPPIAMIVTCPIFCMSIDKIGRKYTLLVVAILHTTSWMLIAFARNIYIFYISRVISGTADACTFVTLPIYIAEVATPTVRGRWGNTMMFLLFTGQFVINAVGYYFSITMTALIMVTFPLLFLVTFIFMPETPYFYIMKGDQERAKYSLRKLRRKNNVDEELQQLTADVQRQLSERGTLKDLFTIPSNRKALLVANLVRTVQQFSGYSALSIYTQYIFIEAGVNLSTGDASMIFCGTLTIVSLFGNLITDKLGRNKSMVFSSIGCGVALLGESIYFYLQNYTTVDLYSINWFPVFGLVLYIFLFGLGLGIVPTLMVGELFSTSIKSHAMLISNIIFAFYICVIGKLFQLLMTNFGLCVPFFFFTLCCFVGAVASYFFVPETKGKTLEDIQQMLKSNSWK